jgi:hypothetical protein
VLCCFGVLAIIRTPKSARSLHIGLSVSVFSRWQLTLHSTLHDLLALEPPRFSYFGIVYAEACVIIMPPCGPPASAAPQMPPEKPPKQFVVAPDVVPPLGGGLSGAPA